jgi:hypothetical protein
LRLRGKQAGSGTPQAKAEGGADNITQSKRKTTQIKSRKKWGRKLVAKERIAENKTNDGL